MAPFLFILSACSGLWSFCHQSFHLVDWPEPPLTLGLIRGLDPAFIPNDFLTNAIVLSPNAPFVNMLVGLCSLFHLQWWQGHLLVKILVVLGLCPSNLFGGQSIRSPGQDPGLSGGVHRLRAILLWQPDHAHFALGVSLSTVAQGEAAEPRAHILWGGGVLVAKSYGEQKRSGASFILDG